MKTLTFTDLQRMYYDVMWAADAEMSQGIVSECIIYWKMAKQFEAAMWAFPATNEFKEVGVCE